MSPPFALYIARQKQCVNPYLYNGVFSQSSRAISAVTGVFGHVVPIPAPETIASFHYLNLTKA